MICQWLIVLKLDGRFWIVRNRKPVGKRLLKSCNNWYFLTLVTKSLYFPINESIAATFNLLYKKIPIYITFIFRFLNSQLKS